MAEGEESGEAGTVSVTFPNQELENARRILVRIARAADRRDVVDGAREVRPGAWPSSAEDPLEETALRVFTVHEAAHRLLPRPFSAEPAWGMLLMLYLADRSGVRHTVGHIIEIAPCSPTTGLRHIDTLQTHGLVYRKRDRKDGRVFYLLLSDKGRQAMDGVFTEALRKLGLAPRRRQRSRK